MSDQSSPARLFFAVWPAPVVQGRLHAIAEWARRECGGRAVAQRNMHATLAFLGNVPRARLHEIEAVAAEIRGTCCDLGVDRLQYWKHNRILWAGVERCPDALAALAGRLARGLRAIGFAVEDRPYVFHITLLRNARRAPAVYAIAPVAWPVGEFSLIESLPQGGGRVYEVLRRWPLEG